MSPSAPTEDFIAKTCHSLQEGSFVRLILSTPVTPEMPRKILGRVAVLRGRRQLSLTLRHPTRDITQNLELTIVATWLNEQLKHHYRGALLGTTHRDWQLITNANGAVRLVDHRPAQTTSSLSDLGNAILAKWIEQLLGVRV